MTNELSKSARQVHTPPRIGSDLYFGILRTFREHGIEIPFPQRDVHLKTVPESVPDFALDLSAERVAVAVVRLVLWRSGDIRSPDDF